MGRMQIADPLREGSLVRLISRHTDPPGVATFWCERAGMNLPLPVGSVALVVDAAARSAVGNEIIVFMQDGEFYSICRYETLELQGRQVTRRPLWCEVIDG